jgi:integrase/recombinase XerD
VKYPAEILTRDEARALLRAPSARASTGVRNRALIAVLYGAGLRISEALALKPSDVDIDAGSIRVLHGKNDQARFAGIDAGTLAHVVAWMELRRALGLHGRHLFCTLQGRPVQSSYVRGMFKRMARRAGLDKRVHPHGMRHTHAAQLEQEGLTVSEIQQQLGHRNLGTTATYLAHISPSERIAKIRARRTEV